MGIIYVQFNNFLNFVSFNFFYWKVIIFAKEQPDEPKPPAIDALLRVYECIINDDGLDVRYNNIVVARILTPSEQAASLIGDQGSVINYIKKASKTNIHVIGNFLTLMHLLEPLVPSIDKFDISGLQLSIYTDAGLWMMHQCIYKLHEFQLTEAHGYSCCLVTLLH